MTDDVPVQPVVDKPLEYPTWAVPYMNLGNWAQKFVHTVGLPWVLAGIMIYYVIPYAKSANNLLEKLSTQADVALPLLHQAAGAVPVLEKIQRTNSTAAAQSHSDFVELHTP